VTDLKLIAKTPSVAQVSRDEEDEDYDEEDKEEDYEDNINGDN
jgi:hypothetical protein